ncbi:MAG: hypothetical protein KDI74_14855 [Gammaproteobacteria bacterium]|nr:hypothetical protein [Gammaproteobacteria bacterium]
MRSSYSLHRVGLTICMGLLLAVSASVHAVENYTLLLKNTTGTGGPLYIGNFQYDPTSGSGGTATFQIVSVSNPSLVWDITANITSTPIHVDDCSPGQPCPSRVRTVTGTSAPAATGPAAGISIELTDTNGIDNRTGTWQFLDATGSPIPNGSGITFIRNATEAATVPAPPIGALLLAGLVPVLILKRRKLLGRVG